MFRLESAAVNPSRPDYLDQVVWYQILAFPENPKLIKKDREKNRRNKEGKPGGAHHLDKKEKKEILRLVKEVIVGNDIIDIKRSIPLKEGKNEQNDKS